MDLMIKFKVFYFILNLEIILLCKRIKKLFNKVKKFYYNI